MADHDSGKASRRKQQKKEKHDAKKYGLVVSEDDLSEDEEDPYNDLDLADG